MKDLFVGTFDSSREISSYDDDGNEVINLIITNAKKLVGDIVVMVKRTVVLYRAEAVKADKTLKVGDCVVFTSAERKARTYKDNTGKTRELVEVVAQGFQVVDKKEFEKNYPALVKMSLPDSDFDYTEADREAEIVYRAGVDKANSPGDDDAPF